MEKRQHIDPNARGYQRAYRACVECRKRKAKCEADGTGPCSRCRRSLHRCFFDQEHRARRSKVVEAGSPRSLIRPGHSPAQDAVLHHASHHQHEDALSSRFSHSQQAASPHPFTSTSPNALASSVVRTVVANGNDALNLLFDLTPSDADHTLQAIEEHEQAVPGGAAQHGTDGRPVSSLVDLVSASPESRPTPATLPTYPAEVLRIWRSCHFVRMGWLTAREAVYYTDMFFQHLSPLSPVLDDFYSHYDNHVQMITQEPMLCCTILMISSRHHTLPGPGGTSKSYFLHNRLWKHCEHLITRVMLGQEKGAQTKARSMGTIESFMLISEWHPRSLHFPPESHGWDADLIARGRGKSHREVGADGGDEYDDVDDDDMEDADPAAQWLEDVIEPTRRSDRMSWMLMGCAISLAHELGLYEPDKTSSTTTAPGDPSDRTSYRKRRIQKLLYVFHTQLASRLGYMSLMPSTIGNIVSKGSRSRSTSSASDEEQWELFMDAWIELTKLIKSIADVFSQSAASTQDCLLSGRYVSLIEHFRPLLNRWRQDYLIDSDLNNKNLRLAIGIEFQSVRVLLNSIGVQAIVVRTVEANPEMRPEDTRPLMMEEHDHDFIQEVLDSCSQILATVNEYSAAGSLRFLPASPVYRIVTASIFVLKALGIGVWQGQLQTSLEILDRFIHALRSNQLDDMHCVPRYAILLEMHVDRLRQHFSQSLKASMVGPTRTASPFSGQPVYDDRANGMTANLDQDSMNLGMEPNASWHDFPGQDWLHLPFDPSMAPFDWNGSQTCAGLEPSGLDFIWNLPVVI